MEMLFKNNTKTICRRDMLKLGASASVAGLLGFNTPAAAKTQSNKSSFPVSGPGQVVRIFMPGMRAKKTPDKRASKKMVEEAVKTLSKEKDAARAWSRIVQKDDRVLIKINALGGPHTATQREVVDAVVDGIRAVGIQNKNIVIFDPFGSSLENAGYVIDEKPNGLRVLSGKTMGYEKPVMAGPFKVNLAKTLTWSSAVINIPVLKEHPKCGVTGAIKNMVFGCVEKPDYMHKQIHDALAYVYALEQIRGRVRLTIMDGSDCQYDGGPGYAPSSRASHDCIYASVDPVAMDAIEWEIVDEVRAKHKLVSLKETGRQPEFLKLAQKMGLGIFDRKKINLRNIELPPLA